MNATASTEARSAAGGSVILTAWRAQREAERAGSVRNDSTLVMSGDPAVLQLFGTSSAASGMSVTATSAMRVAAVFACVTKIAGAIASMPLRVYERDGGARKEIDDAPLHWLLNEQPTARYSSASHWEQVATHQMLRESGYTRIMRSPLGVPRELVPLPWEGVRVEREQTDTSDRLKYFVQDGMRTYGLDQDDMLHMPGFGFNGIRAMSVIQYAARNAAGNAMAMDEYSGRFFAGGAHPSMVLEAKGKMDPDAIAKLQQAFQAKYSGIDQAHKLPLVLTNGIEAKNLSLNAEDAQLLEARKFQVIDIARAFGVPPHMIGETSASTSWGTGIEAMGRAFVTYTLQPYLTRIEKEVNRKLFRTAKRFAEFDREALLEGDSEGQSKLYRTALGGPGSGPGYATVDEIRRRKNLPPLGGKCAEVYFPPEKPASNPKGDPNAETAPAAA